MYYLFHKDNFRENGIDYRELITEGIVKEFNSCYVSSTLKVISYDGKEIENLQSFRSWINNYYDAYSCEEIIISDIRITMKDVTDVVLKYMTDEVEKMIINADSPEDETIKLFETTKEKTILDRKKRVLKDFRETLKKLKNGTLEWK